MPFPLALALLGGAVISGATSLIGASQAASASKQGAATTADAQREQLAYLKEREAIPQQFREEATQELGGLYGLPGGTQTSGIVSPYTDRTGFMQGISNDPMYQRRLNVGEDAVMRNASMTGGLRSGNMQSALYDNAGRAWDETYGRRYNEFQDFQQGLTNMMGIPSNAPQISNVMSGIGRTVGQGQVAAGQAWQTGLQGLSDTAMWGLSEARKGGLI